MNNVAHDGHVQSYQNLQQSQQYAVSNIGPPTLRNRLEAAMRQVVEARYYAVERNDWNLERLLQHADSAIIACLEHADMRARNAISAATEMPET